MTCLHQWAKKEPVFYISRDLCPLWPNVEFPGLTDSEISYFVSAIEEKYSHNEYLSYTLASLLTNSWHRQWWCG